MQAKDGGDLAQGDNGKVGGDGQSVKADAAGVTRRPESRCDKRKMNSDDSFIPMVWEKPTTRRSAFSYSAFRQVTLL